jgi:16S rRNA processing protein RimM
MVKEQREPREGFVAVGRVLRPWGLTGAVKVAPLTDFPDRFLPGARLWLAGVERTVERGHLQRGFPHVKLSGIDTVAAAAAARGLLLEVPEAELRPLAEGEYYHHQLMGLAVVATDGIALGRVGEVLQPGGNAVLVVRGPRGEVLLPFTDDVVRRVDLDTGRIEVELIEGLLPDRRTPRPRGRRSSRRHRPTA